MSETTEFRGGREPDGPSDWSQEPPSDVLLAVGLLRVLRERLGEEPDDPSILERVRRRLGRDEEEA